MADLLIKKVGVVIPLATLIMVGLLSEEKIKYVWWVYITYAVIVTMRDVVTLIQILRINDSRRDVKQTGGT